MQRQRPSTTLPYSVMVGTKVINATLGIAILLYGYHTPTLTILFSSLQVSDGEVFKNNLHELKGFYRRLMTNYSNDIALLQKDTNHMGRNLLLLWEHAVKSGDIYRIQVNNVNENST